MSDVFSCPECSQLNTTNQRTCKKCGAVLNRYCTACGKSLTPDAVSCTNCGQNTDTSNGISTVKNWLNSLRGWYRLFFVYACSHLIIVFATCFSKSHKYWRRHYYGCNDFECYATYIFLHGILPIGGVFLLGLAIRWAIKGFSEERSIAKTKADTIEAKRKRVDSKKKETSKTNVKKVYQPKKRNILFIWVFIAACIIIPAFILQKSEKPRLNVNLMDKDFVTKSEKLGSQSSAVKEKKLSETAIQEQELAKLDSHDSEMKERLDTSTANTDDSLDAMLAIARDKELQAKQLKELKLKKEALEQKELAAIKKLKLERDGVRRKSVNDDLRKYEEIISSEYGKNRKEAAWRNLVSRYPKARDIKVGYTWEFLDITCPKTILRSSYSTLGEDDIKIMINEYNFFDNVRNKNGEFHNVYESWSVVKSGEKTVNDYATGLMWSSSGSGKVLLDHNKAVIWLERLNNKSYAGYSDWRLPTVEEAASLLQSSKQNNLYVDPVFSSEQTQIWTGDIRTGSKSMWIVSFIDGQLMPMESSRLFINWGGVRPVRDFTHNPKPTKVDASNVKPKKKKSTKKRLNNLFK